jgi:hypothetical protein
MEQAMGDFTVLHINNGVGDIHLNRYRIAFRPPPGIPAGIRAQTLASDLIDNFPTYFKSEFATVEFGDRSHEGKPTLHFHGYAKVCGIDLAAPHDDWVVRHWVNRNVGFTAQTLAGTVIAGGVLIPPVAGPLGGSGRGQREAPLLISIASISSPADCRGASATARFLTVT